MKNRVVFSSEVYAAAALNPDGAAAAWLDIAANPEGFLELYASKLIIDGTKRILVETLKLPVSEVDQFIRDLSDTVVVLDHHESEPEGDESLHVLTFAVEHDARFVITGAQRLLKLNPYKGMGVYPPSDMKQAFPPANPPS